MLALVVQPCSPQPCWLYEGTLWLTTKLGQLVAALGSVPSYE